MVHKFSEAFLNELESERNYSFQLGRSISTASLRRHATAKVTKPKAKKIRRVTDSKLATKKG